MFLGRECRLLSSVTRICTWWYDAADQQIFPAIAAITADDIWNTLILAHEGFVGYRRSAPKVLDAKPSISSPKRFLIPE